MPCIKILNSLNLSQGNLSCTFSKISIISNSTCQARNQHHVSQWWLTNQQKHQKHNLLLEDISFTQWWKNWRQGPTDKVSQGKRQKPQIWTVVAILSNQQHKYLDVDALALVPVLFFLDVLHNYKTNRMNNFFTIFCVFVYQMQGWCKWTQTKKSCSFSQKKHTQQETHSLILFKSATKQNRKNICAVNCKIYFASN